MYGARPFEQKQFRTDGVEGVKPAQLAFGAHYRLIYTYLLTLRTLPTVLIVRV